jgi:hypothetical protein
MVASIAATWLHDVEVLTGRLISAVFADIPESTDYETVTYDDLENGCRSYLTRVLALLCNDPERAHEDDVAWSIGRRRAEQGVPLEASLRTFRLGGRVIWEALLERTAVDSIDPRELGAAATAMWTVVDGQSSALSSSYRRAQLEQQRRDDQHRHALIEELLAGHATAGGYCQQIADQLEIPIRGDYLIVVAELVANGTPALRSPQTVLAALGVHSIWHVRTDRLVGIVPLEGHDPQFVFGHLHPLARGRATSTSTPHGLAGIPLAHRLASIALRTLATDTVALVPVEERYPESLLLSSPEVGLRLVNSWLGPVLALPAPERELLLETLTAWLEADQSASIAADQLFCHRNTVLNRLRRVSELIRRDLSGRRAHVEISLALTALELPAM